MKSDYSICVVARGTSADGSEVAPSRHSFRVTVADVNDNSPTVPLSAGGGGKQPPGDDAAAHLGLGRWMQHHGDLSTGSSHVHHIQRAPGDRSVVCKEQQGAHMITVFARDSGFPPLESVATASVRVLD